MELKACVAFLLMLFLGHSHSHSHLGPQQGDQGPHEDLGEEEDISTTILTMNNGSRDFLLEGDMFIPRTRNAMRCFSKTFSCHWPKSDSGTVDVPFTFSSKYNEEERELMLSAMEEFHYRTCVRFVPRATQRMYLSIEPKHGCFSSVGRTGDRQVVSLQRFGCVQRGVVQHELLHALGFQHEQSRDDRDQHVHINYENIRKYFKSNFRKHQTNNLDTPYDYNSIMHYGRNAFSKHARLETITPFPDASVQIGQRKSMSDIDVLRVNKLYDCPALTEEQERRAEEARILLEAKEKMAKEESKKKKPKGPKKVLFKNKSSLF